MDPDLSLLSLEEGKWTLVCVNYHKRAGSGSSYMSIVARSQVVYPNVFSPSLEVRWWTILVSAVTKGQVVDPGASPLSPEVR